VQQVRDGIAQSRLLQRFAHIAHGSFSNLPKSKLGLITLPRMGDLAPNVPAANRGRRRSVSDRLSFRRT
jgi:hypothetical protein